jgi:DNA modification methylase
MEIAEQQLSLPLEISEQVEPEQSRERLVALLNEDLGFHGQGSGYASHNFHSFPAKFPPQLPRKFIEGLTRKGDCILDPMMGSGTTLVEAFLTGRRGLGFDIDPLALMISKVKVTPIDLVETANIGRQIVKRAKVFVREGQDKLEDLLAKRWNRRTREFVDYWFARETQRELLAMVCEIEQVEDPTLRTFFEMALSGTIITKTGGVSLAFDLAHTRPHRAKVVVTRDGETIVGKDLKSDPSPRTRLLTKTLRSVFDAFDQCLVRNLRGMQGMVFGPIEPSVSLGDAQCLPLATGSVDLIVTSPPYASNAIDYMRAHKFSLVWLGHKVGELGQRRGEYIGGEAVTGVEFEELPDVASAVVAEIADVDKKKGCVLHRYYSEMIRTLQEMFRVLRPGSSAIVVVGSSIMRGRDTRTDTCLADIGRAIGFEVPEIGVRELDRNRRMMPAGMKVDLGSQIQQRMHEEYVIGFYKPPKAETRSQGGADGHS